MNPYLIAYMGIKKSESIWFNSVMFAMQSVSMPIGGILQPKIGFRAVTIMGIILSSGGIFLSRVTVDHGLGPFIATYCILFGIGIGLPYSVLMAVASSWFPKYRATIVGLIAAGFGCGALLFTPIQTKIINPNGLTNLTDPTIKAKVPNAFLILGGLMLGLQVYGAERNLDDQYLSIIATLSSAFNALGRVLWGIIVDKFSFKCPLGFLTVIWALFFATFPAIGSSSVLKYIYPIWVFALFFLLAGHFVILPGACGRIFGPENMATLYGLIFFATAPSSLLLSAIISQFTIDGQWIAVYLSAAALCLVSFTLSIFLKDKNGTCTAVTNICTNACNVCRPIVEDEEESSETYPDFEKDSVVRVL
nr:unnamed protein product [Spirometra erinaceieuropaei]